MTHEKPDAHRFRQFLDQLRREIWLSPVQRSWSYFLFHQSNIDNAVSILKQGELLSRASAISRHVLQTDSASPAIIDRTPNQWKHFARLYFRPRNPTFYNVEGFRHANEYPYDAQCPLPVMFIFNLEKVICHRGARFSEGNLAIARTVYSTFEEFRKLPFSHIYHEGPFSKEDRDRIVFHRHAEVIFPDALPLEGFLEKVICRSAAEHDTLIFLLGQEGISQWQRFVGISKNTNLFYKQWLYVERVLLSSNSAQVWLSKPPQGLPIRVEIHAQEALFYAHVPLSFSKSAFQVEFPYAPSYSIRIFIDDKQAYINSFTKPEEDIDLPF
jgi:hypothetical protein